jgi:Domain of unknown function (DUF5671)
MAKADVIREFVHEALLAGRSRHEIYEALSAAGWTKKEIARGLSAFVDQPFNPPIPRPQIQLTARETFLYSVLFTALAFTTGNFVSLIHAILDIWLPDASENSYSRIAAIQTIRWSIASLVVFAPLFVWMTFLTERRTAADASLRTSSVRKWTLYIVLFFSALTLLSDAVYAIYSFLDGELTLRFALKSLTVAGVAGAVFAFYLKDVGDRDDAG